MGNQVGTFSSVASNFSTYIYSGVATTSDDFWFNKVLCGPIGPEFVRKLGTNCVLIVSYDTERTNDEFFNALRGKSSRDYDAIWNFVRALNGNGIIITDSHPQEFNPANNYIMYVTYDVLCRAYAENDIDILIRDITNIDSGEFINRCKSVCDDANKFFYAKPECNESKITKNENLEVNESRSEPSVIKSAVKEILIKIVVAILGLLILGFIALILGKQLDWGSIFDLFFL